MQVEQRHTQSSREFFDSWPSVTVPTYFRAALAEHLARFEASLPPSAPVDAQGRVIMASVKLGAWMSAALDDPNVCAEMKADIQEWFSAGEPVAGWTASIAPTPDREALHWPAEKVFSFTDSPGAHDPCYVVMPDGAMLAVNHWADETTDIARAKWIVDACNQGLRSKSDDGKVSARDSLSAALVAAKEEARIAGQQYMSAAVGTDSHEYEAMMSANRAVRLLKAALATPSVLAESTSNDCLLVAEAVRERCAGQVDTWLKLRHDGRDMTGSERSNGQFRSLASSIRSLDLSGVGVG